MGPTKRQKENKDYCKAYRQKILAKYREKDARANIEVWSMKYWILNGNKIQELQNISIHFWKIAWIFHNVRFSEDT